MLSMVSSPSGNSRMISSFLTLANLRASLYQGPAISRNIYQTDGYQHRFLYPAHTDDDGLSKAAELDRRTPEDSPLYLAQCPSFLRARPYPSLPKTAATRASQQGPGCRGTPPDDPLAKVMHVHTHIPDGVESSRLE